MVVAFCRAICNELVGQTKDRRIMKMLGKNYIETEQVLPLVKKLITELDSNKPPVAA